MISQWAAHRQARAPGDDIPPHLEKVSDGPGQIVGEAENLKATETASLTPMSRALDPVPQVLVDWSELPQHAAPRRPAHGSCLSCSGAKEVGAVVPPIQHARPQ